MSKRENMLREALDRTENQLYEAHREAQKQANSADAWRLIFWSGAVIAVLYVILGAVHGA